MAKAFAMDLGPGVEVSINYNTSNLRITTVDWTLLAGIAARVRIWDGGNLVYDRAVGGPASGSENVPGSYRMVQVTVNGETFLDLPPSLTYAVNIQTIGG